MLSGLTGCGCMPGDQLGDHDTFVAGLVRQPRGSGDVSNGVQPIYTCPTVGIGHHMCAINFDTPSASRPESFDIAHNTNGRDYGVKLKLLNFAAWFLCGPTTLPLPRSSCLTIAFSMMVIPCFTNCFLAKGRDLRILNWQYPVHDFNDSRVSAQGVEESLRTRSRWLQTR